MAELEAQIASVVAAHRDDVLDTLARAREQREVAIRALRDAESQVRTWEYLASLATPHDGVDSSQAEARMTLHDAMAVVLQTAPGRMMRAGDIAAEIERRGLYRMQNGRPVEAQQIRARVGHYETKFTREGTFIKLR
jgi:hypothetical protein